MTDERAPGVLIAKEDGVATVVLHNPEARNALTREIYLQLRDAWDDLDADPEVRVIVFTSSGEKYFSVGGDLTNISTGKLREVGERSGEAWRLSWGMKGISKPVLVSVSGLVAGGALAFVTDGDIVFASRDAKFVDPHVHVGIIVGYAALRLASIIGPSEAKRIGLGCGSLTAERAHTLGLVNELFDTREESLAAAQATARKLAQASPTAVRRTLELMRGLTRPPHDLAAVARADLMLDAHYSHPDLMEGAQAFLEKRSPRWQA